MLPDRVSNPGPLPHESGALPIALRNEIGYMQGFLPKYKILQEFPKQFHTCI